MGVTLVMTGTEIVQGRNWCGIGGDRCGTEIQQDTSLTTNYQLVHGLIDSYRTKEGFYGGKGEEFECDGTGQ